MVSRKERKGKNVKIKGWLEKDTSKENNDKNVKKKSILKLKKESAIKWWEKNCSFHFIMKILRKTASIVVTFVWRIRAEECLFVITLFLWDLCILHIFHSQYLSHNVIALTCNSCFVQCVEKTVKCFSVVYKGRKYRQDYFGDVGTCKSVCTMFVWTYVMYSI